MLLGEPLVVVHDAEGGGPLAGEHGGAHGDAEGGGGVGALEDDAFPSDAVQVGGAHEVQPVAGEAVPALLVCSDEEQVGLGGLNRLALRSRRGFFVCHGARAGVVTNGVGLDKAQGAELGTVPEGEGWELTDLRRPWGPIGAVVRRRRDSQFGPGALLDRS